MLFDHLRHRRPLRRLRILRTRRHHIVNQYHRQKCHHGLHRRYPNHCYRRRLEHHKQEPNERLWQFRCGAGVNAPPITYAVDGVQYVAVAAGGHSMFGFPLGGAVVAFALPQ